MTLEFHSLSNLWLTVLRIFNLTIYKWSRERTDHINIIVLWNDLSIEQSIWIPQDTYGLCALLWISVSYLDNTSFLRPFLNILTTAEGFNERAALVSPQLGKYTLQEGGVGIFGFENGIWDSKIPILTFVRISLMYQASIIIENERAKTAIKRAARIRHIILTDNRRYEFESFSQVNGVNK